ncbi:phage terminase small subunit [Paraburkholderia diazotrophica]|uniref:Phage small terminase subunit n=1 Tax=Paraburkholderia diazotrophica TaxID=667676 RepID=A0A1H7EGI3_9BURK|nr:phage terminase small subunit [Paraburkholderia diazotrophica]SEK13011.1 Phage small terminase subunit [Paraburkholderia diazotrophica]
MTSPAQRHFQRVSASLASASAGEGETMVGSAYELMLAKLAIDRRRLKDIKSIARKIEVKRAELLPDYVEYVAGALSGGRGAQDDVLTTVMIWRVDVGDFAGALDIARYAIAHRMTLPDQYDRTLATAIAEEFAEASLASFKKEAIAIRVDGAQLAEVAQLTESHDMHDQVRAKLHKAIGYTFERDGDLPAALEHLRRALDLDERAGVKQDIARIEKASNAAGTNAGRT